MATAVTMPRLGLTMVEGTVVEWKAAPGDSVAKGQVILVIESEKVEVEVEAFSPGVLAAAYVEPGATVPIGSLLGAIAEPGESFDREAFQQSFVPEIDGAPATTPAAGETMPPAAPLRSPAGGGPKVAPAARALAKKLGVDLEAVAGTGPGGRITVEDVEEAGGAPQKATLATDVVGSGPTVLLISGFGVDRGGWRPQIDALKASRKIVAFDHRGIDGSRPAPRAGWTIAAMADDALQVLQGHGPATVVGASMGAAVAIEMTIIDPQAIRALVLVTPVVEKDPRLEAILRSWVEFESPQAESRVRAILPWLLGRRSLAEAPKREAAAQALRAMAARTPLATLRRHAEALGAWLGTRSEALGKIRARALVIAGDEDLLSPCDRAEKVARAIPGAKLEVLEGAGHAVTIERAEEVSRLIAEMSEPD